MSVAYLKPTISKRIFILLNSLQNDVQNACKKWFQKCSRCYCWNYYHLIFKCYFSFNVVCVSNEQCNTTNKNNNLTDCISKAEGKTTRLNSNNEWANEFVAVKCIRNRKKPASQSGSLAMNLISHSLILRLGATRGKQINIYLMWLRQTTAHTHTHDISIWTMFTPLPSRHTTQTHCHRLHCRRRRNHYRANVMKCSVL